MALDQEIIDYLRDSAETYRFLSQMVFKELNAEAIAAVAEIEFPAETGNAHLDEGYRLVRRYFRFSAEDRRTQLACEYARVFLAAGVYGKGERTAVPYESVFTSPERIMMQASRDDVVRVFLRDGFQVNPDLHEPEDHLAFELEYLAHMSERAAALAEANDVAATARQFAKLAFYPGMLLVAQGTAEASRLTLQDIAAELSGAKAA